MARTGYCLMVLLACVSCLRDSSVSRLASAREVWEGALLRDWRAADISVWLARIPKGLEADAMFALASDPEVTAMEWRAVVAWQNSMPPDSEACRYAWWVQMCYQFNVSEFTREELFEVVAEGDPWRVLKAVRVLCRDTSDSARWVEAAERWANGLMKGSVKETGGNLIFDDLPIQRLGAAMRLVLASAGIDVSRIEEIW